MQLYEMQVTKTTVYRTAPAKIPKGIIGAVVKLSFSPEWENLSKTVVFRAGEVTKDVAGVEAFAVIPAECTREEGVLLEMGVYGVDAENTVAIPTLWATIGRISEAADPSGDETTDPSLPVWAQLQAQIRQLEEQGATQKEVEQVLEMVKQLEEQGVTQREIEQALRDFFGGERPTGKTTPEGGEIFNDYEDNQALAPYSKADGNGCRAGIYGYKLLAVAKSGESYNITVSDAKLDSKARDNYAAGDVLCFDGKGHYYERLKITGLTSNADGNTVITVVPTDDGELSLLAVDSSKDEWENWIYCLDKPDVGVPVLAARGAYAGGVGNTAIGYGAFAFGEGNKAIGKASYAVGRDNTALYAAYVEGKGNYASGQHSHAEGYSTTASGNQSHAEGTSTTAGGASSHAEGNKTIASGVYSHAEGAYSTASGSQSHAEGSSTTASGSSSHTEGYKTIASGEVSHAEGHTTVASGLHSHAEGRGTIAAGQRQHVQGRFNVEDTKNKYAHIVGGGSSDTDRKNIHTLDWDGNAEFAGDVYAAGDVLAKVKDVAPKGLVQEVLNIRTGSDADLMAEIDDIYATMANNSVRHIVAGYNPAHPTLGGTSYLFKICRINKNYGVLDAVTYDVTARKVMRSLNAGVWSEWEWDNPPMNEGVEYRTTERYNGKAVYAMLVDMETLPNTSLKRVRFVNSRINPVSISGVAYNASESNAFPVVFSSGLAAYAYVSYSTGASDILVRTLTDLSTYSAEFIIKYTKD